MSLSVRGIARRFVNRTGALSVRDVFFGGDGGPHMLRQRLESLARQEISFNVSECVYSWTARYEQTWSHVRVRVQLNPDMGISPQTMATLQATWENTIELRWNNRWGIGRPGEITCPLTFDVQWVTNNPHHTVRVRVGPGQSNMTLWDTADTGAVAAHEFGHMHGNPDEYASATCPNRNPVNTGTVMDNNSNNVPQRLMQRLADNVGSNVV
jgi:hypothetical protein